MQRILSIDATTPETHITIVGVEGRKVKLLHHRSAPTAGLFGTIDIGIPSHEEQPAESGSQEADSTPGLLSTALRGLTGKWSRAVLVVPSHDHLSLNLNLPFGDEKSISKILAYEVQDLVPFDLSEFVLHHETLERNGSPGFDVHVSLAPRNYIAEILRRTQEGNIEPAAILTPASVVGAAYYLAPDYFQENSAIVYSRGPYHYVTVRIHGQIKFERVIQRSYTNNTPGEAEHIAIKLTLASAEQKYSETISNVYVFDSQFDKDELQQVLGRSVEVLSLKELATDSNEENALAAVSAVFAQDFQAPRPLSNFRSGEFSFNPKLKELIAGLRGLTPYIIAALSIGLVSLIVLYILGEVRISRIQNSLQSEIQEVIPNVEVQDGKELLDLSTKLKILERQLEDLGSPDDLNPLDAFLAISRVLKVSDSDAVERVSIRGNKIRIEMRVANYGSIDRIERSLKDERTLFCDVNKDTQGLAGNTKVTFDIRLCQ